MAANGRGQAPTVEEQLFVEGHRFEFFQAVALLELLDSGATELGAQGDPTNEAVRFSSSIRLAFPTSEIVSIERNGTDATHPLMTVQFMGLAGALGPLPQPFAELVLGRAIRGDTAAANFLDIFNHRLVSLLYRIKKRHSLGLGATSPEQVHLAHHIYALCGMGTHNLRGRMRAIDERSMLYYAAHLARESRTIVGLTAILSSHFGIPVEAVPLRGSFLPIEPEHRTSIGTAGKNRLLGRDTMLGARYWDQEALFELRVGPLDEEEYSSFLPGRRSSERQRDADSGASERLNEMRDAMPLQGHRLEAFCELVRWYVGMTIDFRIRLVLDPQRSRAMPGQRALRQPNGRDSNLGDRPRLGYTAWVGRAKDRREIVLQSRALPPPAAG